MIPATPCAGAAPRAAGAARGARRLVLGDDVLDLVAGVAGGVLHAAGGAIDLALVLQALVVGQVAGGFLRAALEVVCGPVTHAVSSFGRMPGPTRTARSPRVCAQRGVDRLARGERRALPVRAPPGLLAEPGAGRREARGLQRLGDDRVVPVGAGDLRGAAQPGADL